MKKIYFFAVLSVLTVSLWAGGGKEVEEPIPEPEPPSLVEMISKGDSAGAEEALKIDVSLDETDSMGRTALHAAAEKGMDEIVRNLLARGAPVDPADARGRTPLHLAVENDKAAAIRLLTGAGADPGITDENGGSPASLALEKPPSLLSDLLTDQSINRDLIDGEPLLHGAARRGLEAHVRSLLAEGADPSIRNGKNQSALDAALENPVGVSHVKCAALLLQNGSPKPAAPEWQYITELLRTGVLDLRFDYGSTALHIAAERGSEGMVQYLLSSGAEPDARDQPGKTPLHLAVSKGYRSIVSALMAAGADINARDYSGTALVHESLAVADGGAMLTMLLDRGAEAGVKDDAGSTPLHLAVLLSSDIAAIRLLLDRGVFVDSRDRNGNTPLYLAIEESNREMADLFLSEGAGIFAQNNEDRTPAESALEKGRETAEWFFIDDRLTETDNGGRSVLHHAVTLSSELPVLQTLLDSGANPNLRDLNGETPLHYAVERGRLDEALTIINSGGDFFLDNNSGRSPLVFGFNRGPQFTSALLEDRMNTEDRWGKTPLFHAVQWENLAVVDELLDAGAEVNHQSRQGRTVLHEGVQTDNLDAVVMLIDAGVNLDHGDALGKTALHEAVTWGAFELVRLLVDRGADTDIRDHTGQTALHMATFSRDTVVAEWLLNAGASPNVGDSNGRTPLFFAAESGRVDLTKVLISGGANLSARDNDGRTSLHAAMAAEIVETASHLIDAGSDMFARDRRGRTPFDIVLSGDPQTLKSLLTPGVVNRQDNLGNSLLHLAAMANADPVFISLLLDAGADRGAQNAEGLTPHDLAVELGLSDAGMFR